MDAKNSFYKNAFVNVPLNERGRLAVAGDGYVEFINEDFASMNYACAEHDALTDLFFAYNDTFNILIDDCEDELLPADKVAAVSVLVDRQRDAVPFLDCHHIASSVWSS